MTCRTCSVCAERCPAPLRFRDDFPAIQHRHWRSACAARRAGAEGYEVAAPDEDTRKDYATIFDVSGDADILDTLISRLSPGGEIVLVNHIGAERGLMATLEGWLGRRAAALGWRPEFPWSIVGDWLAQRPDIALVERHRGR